MAGNVKNICEPLPCLTTLRDGIELRIEKSPISYSLAMQEMQTRVTAIQQGDAPGLVWFLEHPSLYTMGTSAKKSDIIDHNRHPIYGTGRGGQVTYHGPGQRIVYLMLNLQQLNIGADLRAYVFLLEQWLMGALKELGIAAERRDGRRGLWVNKINNIDAKIAAIGVRIQKWVTSHGIALNVCPDLSNYEAIVPCGLRNYAVTSVQECGITTTQQQVDQALIKNFNFH